MNLLPFITVIFLVASLVVLFFAVRNITRARKKLNEKTVHELPLSEAQEEAYKLALKIGACGSYKEMQPYRYLLQAYEKKYGADNEDLKDLLKMFEDLEFVFLQKEIMSHIPAGNNWDNTGMK